MENKTQEMVEFIFEPIEEDENIRKENAELRKENELLRNQLREMKNGALAIESLFDGFDRQIRTLLKRGLLDESNTSQSMYP